MNDDRRPSRRDPDDFSEFGSLFDDAEPTGNVERVERESGQQPATPSPDEPEVPADDPWAQHTSQVDAVDGEPDPPRDDEERISFGDDDTGSLPHWTEPPTGEVPRFDVDDAPLEEDDVDPWSTFSSESPVWQDDQPADPSGEVPTADPAAAAAEATTQQPQQRRRVADPSDLATEEHSQIRSGEQARVSAEQPLVEERPNRITIGTDPSGMPRREPQPRRGRGRQGPPPRRQPGSGTAPPATGRDMPTAVAVGMLLAAAFIAVLSVDRLKPWGVVAIVTVVLALAAFEFYGKVSEKGYRPANVPGLVSCVCAPLAAYWIGDAAIPLVLTLGFLAISLSFVGNHSVESGPLPNISITTLGMVWIGLLGSYAMLILRFSTANTVSFSISDNLGTDTLFMLALGVVANDVGAMLVGSVSGRTPLRPWISPNKTVEGFIGGMAFTIIVLLGVKAMPFADSTTWIRWIDVFLLAVVIGIMAPAGDLVESMLKRNLDIKDFGTVVRGHGGILDRFDGFLFTLPAVYYLTEVLEPWTRAG